MSYLLPHLHTGFAVDQAILSVSRSLVVYSCQYCVSLHPSIDIPPVMHAGGGQSGHHSLRSRLGHSMYADGRGKTCAIDWVAISCPHPE